MRQICLDTETTGLSHATGHRIIEIGCVELVNRKLTNNNFHVYLNPNRAVDYGAQRVHGLTNDFLKDKPLFEEIANDLFEYLDGAEIIIHNASFDVGFLNAEFQKLNFGWDDLHDHCTVTDTLAMARKKYPGQKNTLDALCKRLAVDNSHRDLHGALLDSELLADVYLRLTGGQVSLDFENQARVPVQDEVTTVVAVQQSKQPTSSVRVLKASPEEVEAHNNYLKTLQSEQSDQSCLWFEVESNS